MKKFFTLTLCLCLTLSLWACGGSAGAKPSTSPSTAESVTPSVEVSTEPSVTPSVEVSTEPSVTPSVEVSTEPSVTPSVEQTVTPSVEVSTEPSATPSEEPAPPTAEELLAQVTFPSRTVRYNGTRQALTLKNLPNGAEVAFAVNEQTTAADNLDVYDELGAAKPGTYGVTATVTLNEASVTLSAVLTLQKARLSVTAEDKRIDVYAPFPTFTYTLTGLMDCDVFAAACGEEDAPENSEESTLADGEEMIAPSSLATFTGTLGFTCSAERYSPVGIYEIIPYGVESDCYELSFKKGRLFIEDYDTDLMVGGLKQNGNNQMTYNNKAINWQGVNYFSVWQGVFDYNTTGEVVENKVQEAFLGLEELASYNVKVIRFNASFFFEDWWQKCFFQSEEHKQAAIYTMHRVFNKAAELNILLVPAVMWNNRLMLYFNEDCNYAWGNPASQTWQFVMEYQTLLLDNFNDHPALGFWEFGNEWTLKVDVNGSEGLSSTSLHDIRLAWSQLIQSRNQTYRRVIGSGDGGLRASQYNLFFNGIYREDTLEERATYLAYINEGLTATSSHVYVRAPLVNLISALWEDTALQQRLRKEYGLTDETFTQAMRKDYTEHPEKYVGENGLFAKYGADDWTELTQTIEHYIAASKLFGAAFYAGELGLSYTYGETVLQHGALANSYGYYADISYDDIRTFCQKWNEMQTQTKLSLALYWNYEYNVDISNRTGKETGRWDDHGTGTEYSFSPANFEKGRIYLSYLKAHNDTWDAKNA